MSELPEKSNLFFRGILETMVLMVLSEKDLHGYGIIKMIENETGFWRPSPGSVYPLLNTMKQQGLVTCVTRNRRKVYSLTQKGKKRAQQARQLHKHIKSFFDTLARDLYGQPLELLERHEKKFLKNLKDSGLLDELRVFFRTIRGFGDEKLVRVTAMFREFNQKIRDEMC